MTTTHLFDELTIRSVENSDFICAIDTKENRVWPLEIDALWTQPKGNSYLFKIKAHHGEDFFYRQAFKTEQDALKYMNSVSGLMHELGKKKVERQLNRQAKR